MSLPRTSKVRPVSLHQTTLLTTRNPRLRTQHKTIPHITKLQQITIQPTINRSQTSPQVSRFPRKKKGTRHQISRPQDNFTPNLFPITTPRKDHQGKCFPRSFSTRGLAPPTNVHSQGPRSSRHRQIQAKRQEFPSQTRLTRRPSILHLQATSNQTNQRQPRQLFNQLRLTTNPKRKERATRNPSSQVPTQGSFTLPQPGERTGCLRFFKGDAVFGAWERTRVPRHHLPRNTKKARPHKHAKRRGPTHVTTCIHRTPTRQQDQRTQSSKTFKPHLTTNRTNLRTRRRHPTSKSVHGDPSPQGKERIVGFCGLWNCRHASSVHRVQHERATSQVHETRGKGTQPLHETFSQYQNRSRAQWEP